MTPFNSLVTIDRAELTRVAADFPADLTREQWSAIGHGLGSVNACCLWWIGDWLNYGVTKYGDLSRLAVVHADAFHLAPETLRKAALVSQRIPAAVRVAALTWSHHLEVATAAPDRCAHWLKLANDSHWTVAELRGALRTDNADHAAPIARLPGMEWLKAADDLMRLLRRETNASPLDKWTAARRAAVKAELDPLHAFYSAL